MYLEQNWFLKFLRFALNEEAVKRTIRKLRAVSFQLAKNDR